MSTTSKFPWLSPRLRLRESGGDGGQLARVVWLPSMRGMDGRLRSV